ncbi:formate hydrogenlyase subunit 5 precursor [Clostridium homopropionicum DSM 5847]|uniref:Formate hydrogenlyase subunit 5 n=1 Tax=Clostridium homopropionicum DSM 5847 TaxID=1121318 RepID=A0A0L6Z8G4_9CLOT|nr:NADH-quinone oxidoreductase subunit C [Clostridium homopropionicum]KOA19257.1 formate hydrogenlyase subunit 5 precursor [Clostridium homopropionicum DSM 5847]SFG18960.1 Ni,Fe-hydrogenase III large subunit [Clostridium homopropionicum]
MNIALLKEELISQKYNSIIKNKNELYVDSDISNVKELVNTFLSKYKLKFIAEFCNEDFTKADLENNFIINIIFTNSKEGYFVVLRYETKEEIISLQDALFQSHLFEREISDLFGLKIVDGIDKRELVKHEKWQKDIYPLRKSFPHGAKLQEKDEIPPYKFKEIAGDGAYQIPVGPVHAGIIEPGHFRFSVIGEPIENLEIRLNYKHRGIEKLCENIEANQLNLLFERMACESSVAYAESYALLVEKLLNFNVPNEIKALRVVLLELERIYNFLGDIAGICVDVGFSYPAKKYGYFQEQIHQLCERITGSRFMRNAITPCGINIDFRKEQIEDIKATLEGLKNRMNKIIGITLDTVSFLDRVENTGIVRNKTARKLYMTGVVGRASRINYDVRKSFPYEIYEMFKNSNNVEEIGGVFERYKLKISEIWDAFKFISISLDCITKDIIKTKNQFNLVEGTEALTAVETVKGELIVYGQVGKNNKFNRIYFKTPSFTNWNGLTYAVLGEIVPDFPLCNKSFNMSYSENDK